MGILSKLMFWKHEEPGLPSDFGSDFGSGLGGGMGMHGDDSLGLPKSHEGMPEMGSDESMGMPSASPDKPAFAAPRLEEAKPEPFKPSPYPQPAQQPYPQQYTAGGKDIEIISLKIDSIKNTLEAINERLARLEKMAEGGEESHRGRF